MTAAAWSAVGCWSEVGARKTANQFHQHAALECRWIGRMSLPTSTSPLFDPALSDVGAELIARDVSLRTTDLALKPDAQARASAVSLVQDRANVRPDHVLRHWALDPALTFLNHGSYGATPRAALRHQQSLRDRMERDPVRLFKSDLENLMDGAREKLAAFINVNPADLAPIRNATYALCTILQANIRAGLLKAGDEVLVTDHEYGSLSNELERLEAEYGIVTVKAKIPYPCPSPSLVIEKFMGAVTKKTRLAIISHITSTSAMIFPVAPIIRDLQAKGIDVLLDGAHSPGQIPTDVRALAPTYFLGSGHKWLSGPKGSAFMYVRPDRQSIFRPLALSGRANKIRPERALFLRDFDYQGTDDYSAFLSLPVAIEALGTILPGGWPALIRANHEMILKGRDVLCKALALEPPTPDSMVGSMVTLRIPEPPEHLKSRKTCYDDALQDILYEKYRIVVPIWRLSCNDQRIVRISAQVYNTLGEYEYLASALKTELANEWR
jgi:isopenicillin-N epimerase